MAIEFPSLLGLFAIDELDLLETEFGELFVSGVGTKEVVDEDESTECFLLLLVISFENVVTMSLSCLTNSVFCSLSVSIEELVLTSERLFSVSSSQADNAKNIAHTVSNDKNFFILFSSKIDNKKVRQP